jgi:hypothetical protein
MGSSKETKTNNIVRESNVRILQQSVFHFIFISYYQASMLIESQHNLCQWAACTVCIKFCESLEDRVLVNIRL